MAIVTQTNGGGSSADSGGLLMDEFLPFVEFKDVKKKKKEDHYPFRGIKKETVNLSEYLDEGYKTSELLTTFVTNQRKLKITYKVIKGCSDSGDDDGVIQIKTAEEIFGLKLSVTQKSAKYGDAMELELDYTGDEKIEFFLDFYASDDNLDEWNIGELKNVHCGRCSINFDLCEYCSDWSTIAPVIPKKDFVGWNEELHPDWECYDYAAEQLRVAGYQLKAESWRDWSKSTLTKNSDVYQFFLEDDIAGMKQGVQKDQLKDGVKYLKETLGKGIPVMAGVDDDYYMYNDDQTTEHYITIVGMGEDSKGKYFLFYDNATGDVVVGASAENKLYCKCDEHKFEGEGDLNNRYIQGTAKKTYTISHIRKTK
ncbi:hypothetical protein BZG02_16785 [Labilibaculum filiforme]|uniref:Uncharacterized protein n=1 Tax=Labilibaculum filiforme TaxID=1940526 RepID=A0A2N3HSS2_9BACT|nr:hypothetical protein [Labilibaculum filiforme]PKQ61101.1 hypothetical protein BZG02_16785 [Labilibaculum filiforme]